MRIIEKIINMNELFHYTYIKEQKMFQFNAKLQHSNIYRIKEMLEIVGMLDENEIPYILDANQNIVLNEFMNTKHL